MKKKESTRPEITRGTIRRLNEYVYCGPNVAIDWIINNVLDQYDSLKEKCSK